MSEYTPTTDEMRNVYASVQALGIRSGSPGAIEYNHGKAKFDRWLAEVVREAGARALEDAASDWAADPDAWGDNEKDYRNELRARAAEIREGKSE